MTLLETYEQNGVSKRIYDFGERVLASLRGRFEEIDRMAELNQGKVLHAMQTHRVDAACFAATTGYGYDDVGRERLEQVYATIFGAEAALVRPQITCGTHALTVALRRTALPGRPALRHPPGGHRHPALALLSGGVRRDLPPGGPSPRRQL